MKNTKLLLALLAVILVLSASIGPALAYFTTYTVAEGKKPVNVVPDTTITEPKPTTQTKKEITITNSGNAPCFVRVKVFARSELSLSIQSGTNWTGGSYDDNLGCWVFNYENVLMTEAPENKTSTLTIGISGSLPDTVTDYNIAVVYESTTAIWRNNQYETDWTQDVVIIP